jgi:hypothetical protein
MPGCMSRVHRPQACLLLLLTAAACVCRAQENRSADVNAPGRILLQPRFTPGLVLRYRMTVQSASDMRQSGAIRDSQASGKLDITWDATIRLEVFAAPQEPSPVQPAKDSVRLRITYESSSASVRSDTPEPQPGGIEDQYAKLTGRSLEFTLDPSGRVSDVTGLEGFLASDKVREAVQEWMLQISSASGIPSGNIAPGQKWNATRAAELPLAGHSWRTDSTYVRNEPCALAAASAGAGPAAKPATRETNRSGCAVVLSQLALVTTRALRDPTPEDLRRRNLFTSGTWTGSGQGLVYISLDNGWVVSSTQESTQRMDVTVTDAAANPPAAVRSAGTVTTSSQVSLLESPSAVPSSSAVPGKPTQPAKPKAPLAR